MKVRRAIVSVSDKSGLDGLVSALAELGVEIISTGGTATAIERLGQPVTKVEDVTGHPEILGGRVKTLHPKVHGGILARLDLDSDQDELEATGIEPIDLVVVDLYPFEAAAADPNATRAEVIEQIDIGGPTMIRAAAKNANRVAVVTSPSQYGQVTDELRSSGGELSDETRARLQSAAFARTAAYDAAISRWMSTDEAFPQTLSMAFEKTLEMSYGENPHQRAAYYAESGARAHLLGRVEKLHGKDLSFNNLYDLDSARGLLAEFDEPACVIVKHNNPCGVAIADDVLTAYQRARDCDPVSAYGGVIVVNRSIPAELGEELANTFVEVLLAPEISEDAMAALTRKPNTRILVSSEQRTSVPGERDLRRVFGGVLVQDRDADSGSREECTVATTRQPTDAEWDDMLFAWRVAKHVKSNAIVFARDRTTVGIGAGQMSRVDSVRLAIEKAQSPVEGSAMASDAFFPFADGPQAGLDAGVTSVIQPGGSIRDDEVAAAVEAAGAAMVLTGKRHFRH